MAVLIERFYNKEDSLGVQGEMIVTEANQLINGLKKGYGVTAGWNTPDTLAYQLMEYNLFEFAASKTEARMATMMDLLHDKEKNQIRSFNEFKTLVEKEAESFNKNWLRTEYNLSVAVGQTSAAYHRFFEEKDSVTNLVQYQTAGDDQVRDSHAELDGAVFNLNDKEAMDLWPPNGYGCRCEMIQYVGPETKAVSGRVGKEIMTRESPEWKNSQFNINRGNLKQVFTKEQFYHDIKGLPKKLNDMTFDKYNLKPYTAFKDQLNSLLLDESITADNVSELFKKVGKEKFMRFTDYNGRKISLSEKVFKKHTKDKYTNKQELRHQLFPHIKEVLNKPDEVWYNNPDKLEHRFQSRYIKFYKNDFLIIDGEFDSKMGLNIKSWYKAKKEDLDLRKGLLVRNSKR